MQQIMKIVYEGIMILLVMLTIVTIWTENTYNSAINWIVWAIFFIDFLFRFFASEEKWSFIKKNPFLIIAIIPLDQFFQMARIVRIIYFFRIKTITKYYVTPYIEGLTYKTLGIILSLLFLLLLGASAVIWNVEDGISTYFESTLAVFSHLLFFGHRMFGMENSISIWIVTGASIVGILLQGLALQWGFTKAETVYNRIIGKKTTKNEIKRQNN
ncbi:transporter [Virgibacillus indicus]|uniref:Transporter n=1 Tax=Virgibacillus indicus TaxID=2024554 RepID=A0A265NDB4_9BACI|nr:transporter [Virgibacillus indicus]OZU89459.1 transporter [Virgibacillus indicus]